MTIFSSYKQTIATFILLVCLGFFCNSLTAQSLESISIEVTFESDTDEYTAALAPLKYNKRFALSMQIDDGNSSIIDYGFPVFEGGNVDGTDYPGLNFTDGCGNSHSFKMTSAIYMFAGNGATGLDLHNDPSTDVITWQELNTLYENNWGVGNHGVNSNADLIPDFMDYSIARNTSYCRRKMYNATPGGVIPGIFVNPNGAGGWTEPALELGNLCALNQNNTGPLGDKGGNVNETGLDWAGERYNLYRLIAESISVKGLADDLEEQSLDGANFWAPIFTHSIPNDYGFSKFASDFTYVADTYGANGTDEILMTTDEEILDYLILRDGTTVNQSITGDVLTITFTGNTPNNLLFYDLSLVVNSDVVITDVTIVGTDNFSVSDLGNLNALVNFSWDGKVIPSPETLASEYTATASSTQTEYDALIAMDYVSVLEYGDFKDGLVSELCNIGGVDYDEGFCTSGYPDFVLITGDSVISSGETATLTATGFLESYSWSTGHTTSSITVTPSTDTKYWVDSETKYGNTVTDTIMVIITDSYIVDHSPLIIHHVSGQPDSLWVELEDGATPLWSNASTNDFIIVDPDETTIYTLQVIANEIVVDELEYEVVVGNLIEFTYDSVCFGEITTLMNTSLVNDTITDILWDLNGDTQFDDAEGETVEYTFTTSGNHLVGMRVYFKNSPMNVVYNPVPVGDAPFVDFSFENVCHGSTTLFYDESTVNVGVIDAWFWRFGDGKTDGFQNTSNYYEEAGNYETMLVVWSSAGCKDSIQKAVDIFSSPVIELKTSNDSVVNNYDTVYFYQGQTTTITISDFSSYDSVIWFDDSRAESVTIAEEGSFFVNVFKTDCEAKQNFYTSWGGSPQPSGDDIMNLFTPNGDGFNDYWIVNDPQITSPFKVGVYNRSGRQVYSNNNYQNNWDGKYDGNPLPQTTYYYVIEDSQGKSFKGAITIIR
jgi:gliding motility-associated-like protein